VDQQMMGLVCHQKIRMLNTNCMGLSWEWELLCFAHVSQIR